MNPWHEFVIHPQIIPTVLIPLTAVSVALSSLAVFIAGLFGLKLKADGPKKLLEVLLKPRVLIAAALMNVTLWVGYQGVLWMKNRASFDLTAALRQRLLAKPSEQNYTAITQYMGTYKFTSSCRAHSDTFSLVPSWQMRLPAKGSFSEPMISGNSLFVGSEDGFVYEINQESGVIERKFYVGKPVTPGVLLYHGGLYAGEGNHDTHHARVSKFDLKTGQFIKAFTTMGHIEGQLTLDEQANLPTLLFVSGGRGGLYAINPETMKLVWNSNVGHNDSGVRVDGDLVFFGTGREKHNNNSYRSWALAVKRSSGEVVWKRELPASSWMLPLVQNDQACFVFGEVYFKSEIGGIGCFDKKTGQSVRVYYHSAPIVSNPILYNGDFILTDFNGQTCRVNSRTMTARWCQQVSKESYTLSGPRYDAKSDSLIQTTRKAKIVVLDPESGVQKTEWQLFPDKGGKAFAPVALGEKDLFFADMEGNITRLERKSDSLLSAQKQGP